MKKVIIILTIALAVDASYSMDIESFNISKITDASAFDLPLPSKAIAEDETIGIDASIKIPFKMLNNMFLQISSENPMISLINPSLQPIGKSGENLKFSNVRLNINGIIAEPVFLLKPYLEGKNALAIRIEKVKFHILMTPDKGLKKAAEQEFNIEDAMQQAMDALIKEIMKNLNKKFSEKNIPLKAEEALNMKYFKKEWVLRAKISPALLKAFMPANLIGNIYITAFSYTDTAINLRVIVGK